jgi:hypothetical protein
MNNRTTLRKRTILSVLFNSLIGAFLILAGCVTFEVGIERTATPDDTVTPTAEIPATSSPASRSRLCQGGRCLAVDGRERRSHAAHPYGRRRRWQCENL